VSKNAFRIALLGLFAVAYVCTVMAQEDTHTPNVVGNWSVTIRRSAADGNLSQQWVIKQNGADFSGTVKSNGGELPMTGKLNGPILRATITDGDMRYIVNASVSSTGDTMDGTIRMGTHEYILSVKRP